MEEIDGVPTPALAERCRKMGLKVHVVERIQGSRTDLTELVGLMKELVECKHPPPSAPPAEAESDSDPGEEPEDGYRIAAMRRGRKEKKRERKDARRRKVQFDEEE